MRVSVVIPAWNERNRLRRLLTTLAHTVVDPADRMDVVVVDDGSTDGTGDTIAAPAKCVRLTRSGRAAARNAGIAEATGELIVLLDADQLVGPAFIAAHIHAHRQRDDLVVIGPRHELADGPIDEDRLARGFTLDAVPPVARGDDRELLLAELSADLNELAIRWHLMFSCNVSVRTEHLRAVGGFDEAFTGWGLEDCELGYRMHQRGMTFAWNPAATTYHQQAQHIDADKYAQFTRNLTYMIGKHRTPEVALQELIGRALDPAGHATSWLEAARRFEIEARALRRLSPPTTGRSAAATGTHATTTGCPH
ncbi:glycosyltransferase [Actinocrispum sp. NPDC049592]|uniref:glycosyltransferase family 2 protein n=1 Tax=Actinocrispum sp. NPDC049592 TaxID=3154835 RepID=UPI003436A7F4